MKKKKQDIRKIWQAMFPEAAQKFLDIGCGNGNQTKHLLEEGKEVVGIEIEKDQAKTAEEVLSNVLIADAEKLDIPYEEGYFDCLIYGGVIGAFRNPLEVIKSHARYLKPGGYIVAHVPNLRYYKVINMLLFKGVWDVMPQGILYHPYVRHFTLINYKELLAEARFTIEEIKTNVYANSFMRFLNAITFHLFEEFIIYEYLFKAKKVESTEQARKLPARKKVVF